VVTEADYFPYLFLEGVGGVNGYGEEVFVADELTCLSDLFVSVPNYYGVAFISFEYGGFVLS